ncbi:MAG: hypothetical protein CMM01_01615 [Rhodopirellula sp.]|nr:hypothetical protein [Rhodopirellula sp.]
MTVGSCVICSSRTCLESLNELPNALKIVKISVRWLSKKRDHFPAPAAAIRPMPPCICSRPEGDKPQFGNTGA